jgi:hypothetical protein
MCLPSLVMAGLDPAIQRFRFGNVVLDHRGKPGDDKGK